MVTQNKERKNGIWKKKCPRMIKPTNRTEIYIYMTISNGIMVEPLNKHLVNRIHDNQQYYEIREIVQRNEMLSMTSL